MKKSIESVSRRQIIQAILTEPLQGGAWTSDIHDRTQSCPVCAVGAVMRSVGVPNAWIDNRAWGLVKQGGNSVASISAEASEYDVQEHLEKKNWMGALSAEFERLWSQKRERRYRRHETRQELVKFVKKHFPKEVLLNNPLPEYVLL